MDERRLEVNVKDAENVDEMEDDANEEEDIA